MGDPLKVFMQDERPADGFKWDEVREAEVTFGVGQRDRRLGPRKVIVQAEPHAEGFKWEEVRKAEVTFGVGQRDRRQEPLTIIVQDEPHGKRFVRDEVRAAEVTFTVGQRDRRLEPLKVVVQDEPHGKGLVRDEERAAEVTLTVGQRDRKLEPRKVAVQDGPHGKAFERATFGVGQLDRRLEPRKVIVQDEPQGKGFERDEVCEAEATFSGGQHDWRLEPLKVAVQDEAHGKAFERNEVREAEADTSQKENPWLPRATVMHPWLFPEGSPAPASASKPHVAHTTFPKNVGRKAHGASRNTFDNGPPGAFRNTFYDVYFDNGPPGRPQRSSSAPVTGIQRSMGTIRCNFGFGCTPCQYMPRDFLKKNTPSCQPPPYRTNFCKRDDEGNVVDLPKICRNGVQCRHCHCHPKKNFQRLKSRVARWAKIREQTG